MCNVTKTQRRKKKLRYLGKVVTEVVIKRGGLGGDERETNEIKQKLAQTRSSIRKNI